MRYCSACSAWESVKDMKSTNGGTLNSRCDRVAELREESTLFTPLTVGYRLLKKANGKLFEIDARIQGIGYSGLLVKTERPLLLQDKVIFQFKLGLGLTDEAIHGIVAFTYRDEVGIRFNTLTNRQCAAIEALISLTNS